MPYRLPDTTFERALHVALDGLRSVHRFRLADSILTIERGWRIRGLLWSLAGLLVIAALFVVVVSLWFATPEQAVPTWARVVLGLLLGLGLLGSVLGTRPVGVRIDARQRRVYGRGGDGSFAVQLSAGASVRITRTLTDERTGSGSIELVDGDATYRVLDVEDVSFATLTRLEVLTMALSAWLELPWRDASDAETLRQLGPSDERVGVARRDEGVDVGDVVVAALEILQALG